MLKTVFFLAIVAAAPVLFYLRYRAASRRRAAFRMVGRQLRLSYAAYDLDGSSQQPFSLFRKGDGRAVENVLSGLWQGVPITAFDFFYWEAPDRNTRRSGPRQTRRFQCAIVEIDAFCPRLSIEREDIASRLAGEAGLGDIEFESAEFNRTFRVLSEDRRFAFELIDPPMMGWLLDASHGYEFEVVASRVLVWGKPVAPTAIIPLLGTATDFVRRVPRIVHALYG